MNIAKSIVEKRAFLGLGKKEEKVEEPTIPNTNQVNVPWPSWPSGESDSYEEDEATLIKALRSMGYAQVLPDEYGNYLLNKSNSPRTRNETKGWDSWFHETGDVTPIGSKESILDGFELANALKLKYPNNK